MVGAGDDQLLGSGRGTLITQKMFLLSGVYAGIILFFLHESLEKDFYLSGVSNLRRDFP